MAELVIGTVATPQPWRRALQAHVRDHVAGVRLVTLHDTRDALNADVDVVVVDDTLDFLTEAEARVLRDRGTRIVGVCDPSGRDGRGRQPLDDLKIETVVPISQGPEALLDAVATLSPTRRHAGRHDDAVARLDQPPNGREPIGRGAVVAVGGGSDAPGRTEIAVALAQRLAVSGEPVLLVDLDERNPSVARRLGYQLTPNVLDAVTALVAGGPLDTAVAQPAPFATGTIDMNVIAGVPHPGDGAPLGDVTALIDEATRRWPWVVVDTGPSCHTDNAATRAALARADHLLAIASPTPLGVLRLFDWLPASAEVNRGRPFTVVVNRAPRDGFRREELRGQIIEHLPDGLVEDVCFVADDRAVLDAVWDATPVGRSRFTRDVDLLCARIGPQHGFKDRRRSRVLGGRR
jgi:MinD-like ATPase involved in chromosome partitioning or flagellar assembly